MPVQIAPSAGVNGHEAELRSASDEFSGHCLALTLLGSYLTDAYNGDIRCREGVRNVLLTMSAREPMPKSNGILRNCGWGRDLSCPFSAC